MATGWSGLGEWINPLDSSVQPLRSPNVRAESVCGSSCVRFCGATTPGTLYVPQSSTSTCAGTRSWMPFHSALVTTTCPPCTAATSRRARQGALPM